MLRWDIKRQFLILTACISVCILGLSTQASTKPMSGSFSAVDTVYKSEFTEFIHIALKIKSNKLNPVQVVIVSKTADTSLVREYFLPNLYFEGKEVNGLKFNTWQGFFNGKRFMETLFLGDSQKTAVYLYLWNKKGRLITYNSYSVIR